MDEKLLDILACPECKGDLDYDKENNQLDCKNCKLKFKIENDIPILLIEKAEKY